VTAEMRARAKTINFATIYGQGAFALSRQLGITQDEAKEFIKQYFIRFAGVRAGTGPFLRMPVFHPGFLRQAGEAQRLMSIHPRAHRPRSDGKIRSRGHGITLAAIESQVAKMAGCPALPS